MNWLEFFAVTFVLIVARVTMFFATFPLFRGGTIPQVVKVSLSVALAGLWMPDMPEAAEGLPSLLGEVGWVGLLMALTREAIIGGMFGFALGLFFLPTQIAGAYLGQEIGFNMAGMTDPTTDAVSNVFGDILGALATLLFFTADTHLLAIGTLRMSFENIPLGQGVPFMTGAELANSFSDAHRVGLELAAPLAVGLFLTTALTALLMKISPQLNLLSVGTSLRLLVGIAIAYLFLPEMLALVQNIVMRQIEFVARMHW